MEWISVENDLPKPFEVVWIYWRDREVMLGCRTYDNDERYKTEPCEGWYSFKDEKSRWTEWWQRVDASNLDKPLPPKKDWIKGWISFSDEMPRHNQLVKVKSDNLWNAEGIFQDGKFVYSWMKGACFGNPTHWMPLAELSKEKVEQ